MRKDVWDTKVVKEMLDEPDLYATLDKKKSVM